MDRIQVRAPLELKAQSQRYPAGSKWSLIGALILLCLMAGPSWAGDEPLTFLPQWSPQAQFAGYYTAYEMGFYKKHGLNVKILRGGPYYSPTSYLESGRTTFATMFLSTAVKQRAHGIRLVNIAQIVRRSAIMLISLKTAGITTPESLNGKRLGLWLTDAQIPVLAFLKRYDLRVTLVPQTNTMNLFLRGAIDAASAMWYNEYHEVLNSGINRDEMNGLALRDYGINFPEDGIYCMEETFRRDPAACCSFAQASIEGWQYAFAHPEEALDVVMKYVTDAKISTNRIHQRWMLERMRELILPAGSDAAIGVLNQCDYEWTASELKKLELIDHIAPYHEFHRNCSAAGP